MVGWEECHWKRCDEKAALSAFDGDDSIDNKVSREGGPNFISVDDELNDGAK